MPRPNDVGVGIALLIINDQGQVLMLRRQGAHGAGTWCPPGGWVDRTDSSLEKTCVREAKEELGITVPLSGVRFLTVSTEDFPDFRSVTVFYWTRQFFGDPEIQEPDKATEWAWIDPHNPPNPLFGSLPKIWPLLVSNFWICC